MSDKKTYESFPLTKLLNRYSAGAISKKDLEGQIYKFILDNYQQFHPYGWNMDDYMDYICWLYPRISAAIENYRDTGASFDAYINSMVRWCSKEYRAREAEHQTAEYACWKARAQDDAACAEEEAVYLEPEPVFDAVNNPRQILVLLLKSYHYMSADFLERISPALNMDPKKLGELVEGLRKLRLEREEGIRLLQERIHSQFYRCIIFERKLMKVSPNSGRHETLERCLVRGRKRLVSMRERLAGMKTGASNRQVAEILESKKGTVDAHLAAVKAKWKQYDDNDTD
ncbi:hypothetical protein AGMMS49944_20800 [Spirochaetia bacterium]|nr:hypothetical protein AGMMS49944_20800 [Spirochaetia bacterium]